MSDLWLPGMPQNGQPGRVVRPFERIGREVKRMGFDVRVANDEKEYVMRVRFVPTTIKTREACVSAGGDGDGLEVSRTYTVLDNPGEVCLACIEHGLNALKDLL